MLTRKILLLFLLASVIACQQQSEKGSSPNTFVVPQPVSWSAGNGTFTLPENLTIETNAEDGRNVAGFLKDFLATKNIASAVSENGPGQIRLLIEQNDSIGHEGYNLSVNNSGITITAGTGAGLFYGSQTLMQLIHSHPDGITHTTITDYPRYQWRGLHLDVGRHMFPVEFIKKYIDLMSHYKFNSFHWHLTEDQGWRIEIKKYPKLQEIAAYRKETVVGHAGSTTRDKATYDGKRYGGFYTQEEIKDVVAYAAKRYINVVPEIELPGHSQAALAAYPHLGCTGGPYETATTWGVFDDVYCAGKETTFQFLQDVLDEVVVLFPSQYIHIGGDESPKSRWEKCRHCQKRIKDEKLKDEHELQSYFIQRIEKYLNAKGRKIIGWDEILEGGLAPNATVMSWRGEDGGIAAAKAGHDVVMSPGFAVYFDHYQGDPAKEPLAIGGLTPVKEVYHYEPTPSALAESERKHVLGAQANVWTEYITTTDHVEYMVYPRALALSEVLWSPAGTRDWKNFEERLEKNLTLLDLWDVNYRKPQPADSLLVPQ